VIVPDASYVLAAMLPDEPGDPNALELLKSESAAAPSIWPIEVANAILVAVRRKRISPDEALSLLDILAKLDVELVTSSLADVARNVVPLARKHRLTAYDAAYLDVARSKAATLMTIDRDLRTAAEAEDVVVL